MEKIAIVLLLLAVVYAKEDNSNSNSTSNNNSINNRNVKSRTPKQLYSYSPFLFPGNYQAGFPTQSHLPPVYSFWSNLQTVPALNSKSTVNGQQGLQLTSQLPVTAHVQPLQQQQPYIQVQPQQQGQPQQAQLLLNPQSLAYPLQSPSPLAYSQVYHGNIWNFDDSLTAHNKNKHPVVAVDSSSKRDALNYYFAFPNVNFGPALNAYRRQQIEQQQQQVELERQKHHQGAFQRGNIESRPGTYRESSPSENFSGFVRSHIESHPQRDRDGMRRTEDDEYHGESRGYAVRQSYRHSNSNNNNNNGATVTNFNRGAVEGVPDTLGKPSDEYSVNNYGRATGDKKVVCYFANWAWYRKGKASFVPENVDPNLCTHIIYAFATYDKAKITIAPSDNWTDVSNDFFSRTVALKQRNPNLKVLLSVGGWADSGDDKYSNLAHSPSQRQKFAQESLVFLKKYGFDGLAVDWHYPKCWQSNCDAGPASDSVAFGDLLRELRSVYAPEGLLLSATLSGYKEVIDVAYHVPTLNALLDLMNIMTYDYHGAWESTTGHVSPLFQGPAGFDNYPHYNSNFTMEYYVSLGADRSKLIMGVPMYGQSFQLNRGTTHVGSEADGPGNPGEYTQQPGMLAYYEICSRVKDKGWTVYNERTASWGPIAYDTTGQWVGYDDPEFVARKTRYVRAKGFGGVFVWTMDLDDFNNDCCTGTQPLLRTIARELLNIPFNTRQQSCTPPPPPSTPAPAITTTYKSPRPTAPSHTHEPSTSTVWWRPTSSTTPSPATPSWWTTSTTTTTPTTTITWWPTTPSTTSTTPRTTTYYPPPPSTTSSSSFSTSKYPIVQVTTSKTPTTTTPRTTTIVLTCHHQTTKTPIDSSNIVSGNETLVDGNVCNSSTFTITADANDCSTYYQCVYDRIVVQSCSPGLHYNAMGQKCDWPEEAKCYRGPGSGSGVTQGSPTYPTQPTHTTSYPYPYPETTTRATTSWPSWSTWPTASTPSQAFVTSTTTSTGECNDGDYLPAETCEGYYLCTMGRKTLQQCGPGLHWDRIKRLCDWPSEAKCQAYQHENKIKPLDQGIRQQPCQEGTFAPSKSDCSTYYVCVHGENVPFHCQGGLFWNQGSKNCDWPSQVNCVFSESGSAPGSSQSEMITAAQQVQTTTPHMPPMVQPVIDSNRPIQGGHVTPGTTARPQPPSFGQVTGQNTPSKSDFMVVCYFTNWAWYRQEQGRYKPDNINPNLCTHVIYGFAVLDYERLEIKVFDGWADIDNKFYEQVTALRARGIKVSIAIGGWNDSQGDKYSRLVSSPQARARFVRHVVEFIQKYNFDGLDLDWEYPKCWQVECNKGPDSDKPNFAHLVRELKEAFRPHGYLLSAAVSPSKTVVDLGYDVPTLSQYLDWIAVMTYDFHGQWDKKTGHVAPLYFHEEDDFYYFNANYSINYWISQGADRRKIVMGMPLYGQSFTLVNPSNNGLNAPSSGGGTAGRYTKASGFLAYYEICHNIQREGWTVVEDPTGAMGPYAYRGNQWVSYDDVNMIARKSQLIRDLDLGGGMIWALDLDDFRNTCGQGEYPLLTTIKNVLSEPRRGSPSRFTPNNGHKNKPNDMVIASGGASHQQLISPPVMNIISSTNENKMLLNQQRPSPPIPIKSEDVENDVCSDEPFRPHATNCNLYYQCLFGRYVVQRCPPGTYWNENRCDWKCGREPTVGAGVTTTRRPPSATAPTSGTATTPRQTTTTTTTTKRTTTQQSWTHAPHQQTTQAPTQNQRPPPSESVSYNCPTMGPKPDWEPATATETNTAAPINIPDSEYKVVCYFTNWAWYRPGIGKYKPSDIDFNLCTHIAYGFAVLDPSNLVLRPHDGWADLENKFYRQVVQLKARGLKVVLALGGWNDSLGDKYSKLVNNPAARRRFIEHVVQFLERHCFDGLDLDWEYPKCWQVDCNKGPDSDKQGFADLVRELSEAFKPRGLLLSAAVSPSKTVIDQGYDVPALSKYMDWISVMTYDFHGQWDKKTGHVAPLYFHEDDDVAFFNTNFTMNYWINQGADRKKLIMGMPLYGQSFTLVDPSNTGLNSPTSGGGTAGEFTRQSGFLAYYEICRNILSRSWKVVQDETGAMGPYAYSGNQWASYDDIQTIRRKSEYIKQMGLGGGMIWALDLDDFRNVCGCGSHPLLKTINRVLRKYPESQQSCNLS